MKKKPYVQKGKSSIEEINATFIERIKEHLTVENISTEDFSEKLGISVSATRRLLNNNTKLSLNKMVQISNTLNKRIKIVL